MTRKPGSRPTPIARALAHRVSQRIDSASRQTRGQLKDEFGRPIRRGNIEDLIQDSWANPLTGLGMGNDKSQAAHFAPVRRLTDQECTNLMNGSSLARKIVEKRPKEMFRRGYDLASAKPKGEKGNQNAKANVEASEADELHDAANERFHIDEQFPKAQIYSNLYGGGVLLLGADDGGMPDEPLDERKIRNFNFVNFVDRRFVYVESYYNDQLQPDYGRPSHYLVSQGVPGGYEDDRRKPKAGAFRKSGFGAQVWHESRLIRFEGTGADDITMRTLAGWTWSVLQAVYDDMKKYETSFDAVRYLISDASQAVFKLEGLIAQISANQGPKIRRRIQMLEDTRSVMHGILLDSATESFERAQTPFGGLADLLDKMMLTLSAACDIPVTELFGRAPGGLNTTTGGGAEERKWYDSIATLQKQEMAPRLKRFYRLYALSDDSPIGRKDVKWDIEFEPLWAPTDDESAKTALALAQMDALYIANGVVSPEEVALERQDLYESMDVDAREKAMKATVSFDPHENDEPDVPPTAGEIPSPSVPLPIPQDPRNPKPQAPQGQSSGLADMPQRPAKKPAAKKADAKIPQPDAGKTRQTLGPSPTGSGPMGPVSKETVSKTGDEAAEKIKALSGIDFVGARKGFGDDKDAWKNKRDADDARHDSANIADAVHSQLAEDYPPEAIDWVKAAKWKGPGHVPLSRIDFSGAESWQASHDQVHVDVHKARISNGTEKPIILVKTTHSKKLVVVDGHHRSLAYQQLGKSPRAYVATVESGNGPWDKMHDSQKTGLLASVQKDG